MRDDRYKLIHNLATYKTSKEKWDYEVLRFTSFDDSGLCRDVVRVRLTVVCRE